MLEIQLKIKEASEATQVATEASATFNESTSLKLQKLLDDPTSRWTLFVAAVTLAATLIVPGCQTIVDIGHQKIETQESDRTHSDELRRREQFDRELMLQKRKDSEHWRAFYRLLEKLNSLGSPSR